VESPFLREPGDHSSLEAGNWCKDSPKLGVMTRGVLDPVLLGIEGAREDAPLDGRYKPAKGRKTSTVPGSRQCPKPRH